MEELSGELERAAEDVALALEDRVLLCDFVLVLDVWLSTCTIVTLTVVALVAIVGVAFGDSVMVWRIEIVVGAETVEMAVVVSPPSTSTTE